MTSAPKCSTCSRKVARGPRCPSCAAKHREAQRARPSEAKRRVWRKSRWGLTDEDFEALLLAHNHQCAVCGATQGDARGRALYIDHDHATGRIRGILCNACNTALGLARDDPDRLRALAAYLEGAP